MYKKRKVKTVTDLLDTWTQYSELLRCVKGDQGQQNEVTSSAGSENLLLSSFLRLLQGLTASCLQCRTKNVR